MQRHVKRGFVVVAGIALLLLGLVGIILPVLPGLLLGAAGIILLSMVSPRVRTFLEHHTRKFPKLHEAVEKTENKFAGWLGEL